MATGRLWELAAISDMPSVPTLRQFMRERPDFPVIAYGGKGVGYVLDLDAAAAFVRAHWRDSRATLSGRARASRAAPAGDDPEPQLPFPAVPDAGQPNDDPGRSRPSEEQ